MGLDTEKDMDTVSVGRWSLNLSPSLRIWAVFLVPTSLCCAIYIADVATDIALAERHFAEGRLVPAYLTILLIYAPAVAFLALTLLDEEKWPEVEVGSSKRSLWVLKQVALALVFPIHAMHRFAGRLFWSLEALLCPEDEKEEALAEASKTSTAELYLLLQAFLQAAPQAILQTFILTRHKIPHERTGAIQVLGIMTSIASTAIAATTYMRFESQRIAGRETPWTIHKPTEKQGLAPKESLMTTIESQMTSDTGENSPTEQPEERPESPRQPALPKGVPQSAILSLPPLPPQIRARLLKASGDDVPDDLKKDLDQNEGEPLNIRSSIYGTLKSNDKSEMGVLDFGVPPSSPAPPLPSPPPIPVSPPSLPDTPPPPPPIPLDIPLDDDIVLDLPESPEPGNVPASEAVDPADTADTAESESHSAEQSPTVELRIEEHLSSEPLLEPSTATLEVKPATPITNYSAIPLPTRKWKIQGLGEDDVVGRFVGFIWWYLFITSRVLTLATLLFFYPVGFAALVLLHHLAMLSYLLYCEKSKEVTTKVLQFLLGFVYLVCFIEIRTRFKNPKNFTLGFMVLCEFENLVSSGAWFLFGAWTSWWFLYTFYLIIVSFLLSILAMGMYLSILKPITHDIYTN